MSKHLYWDWTAQQISEELVEVSQELLMTRKHSANDWQSIMSLENTISDLTAALVEREREEAGN